MSATKRTLTEPQIAKLGKVHAATIRIDPAERPDLNFGGAVKTIAVEKHPLYYEITADLPRRLQSCPNCGAPNISLHGRYVVRLADLPYVDAAGRAMPVQYALNAQRYQCFACEKGVVEPLPEPLTPVLTAARITRRLSEWLLWTLQSEEPYETIARMTGYSKVWVRKWFTEVRKHLKLEREGARPGPKPKKKTAA